MSSSSRSSSRLVSSSRPLLVVLCALRLVIMVGRIVIVWCSPQLPVSLCVCIYMKCVMLVVCVHRVYEVCYVSCVCVHRVGYRRGSLPLGWPTGEVAPQF